MKRNIITNFLIQKDAISIQVYEKLPTATVELFNARSTWVDYHLFIKDTLRSVEKSVGGKISRVSIILDPFDEVEQQINLTSQSIKIPNGLVQRKTLITCWH
ncbi:hypothetical protein [Mycoplasma sp. ATU-Cv-508]|uniref:hypothetical protein n=1 Tax=Mycoplasma sp. ATU-Cv-508 TaxID=2048001 RepID=UPI000FDD29FB